MSEEKQKAPGALSSKTLRENRRRRGKQRRQALRDELIASLASMLDCSLSEIPRYARVHGIPL